MTSHIKALLAEKLKELEQAEDYFDHCSQRDFETANMRLTLIRAELDTIYRELKETEEIA